jgi:hypothetical protein
LTVISSDSEQQAEECGKGEEEREEEIEKKEEETYEDQKGGCEE